MGTSRRVVRKGTSPPGDPGRSTSADPCGRASLRKRKGCTNSRHQICISGCSRRAAVVEQQSVYHRVSWSRKTLGNVAGLAPRAHQSGKLYGFPTVSSGSLLSHATLRLRTRQKSHSHPRAREAISFEKTQICLDVDASVWPGCNLQFRNLLSFNGAAMAWAGRILVWWDRDFDGSGRPIRPDVRSAGREIWEQACQQTMAVVADDAPAAELMETAVAQVSRYLDRIAAPMSSQKHGLVMAAFCRALRRYRAKSARLELVGTSHDFADCAITNGWLAQADARLDLERVLRRLSGRHAEVLMLRAAGYQWKEVAQTFGTTVAAIRNSFWREIEKIRWEERDE